MPELLDDELELLLDELVELEELLEDELELLEDELEEDELEEELEPLPVSAGGVPL